MQDVIDYRVEESAIMRDQQHRLIEIVEIALEPAGGGQIEVIGGFVEDQEIGGCRELTGKRQPAPLATRQGDRLARARLDRIEPQTGEHRVDARRSGIAAGMFESLEVVGITIEHFWRRLIAGVADGVGLGRQVVLQLQQLGEPARCGVPHGDRATQVAILVHHGDPHSRRARDDAAIRLPIARDQLHQGGLAGAVPTDHAPAFTAFDLEGDAGEEGVGAEDDGEFAARDQGHEGDKANPSPIMAID